MKKTKLFKVFTVVWLLLCSNEALAQFIISGELRPRVEYRDGYKQMNTMTDAPAFFISQRTRLNLGFTNQRFKTYLSLQDVRTWGSQKQLVANEANAFSIHEAWGEVFLGKKNEFSLKLGRQEIILDDHRIFGSVGWAQQARSHDALILKYSNTKVFETQLGLAYNQNMGALTNTSYTVPKSYKTMQYLWLNKKAFDKKLSVSLLFLNKGDEVRFDKNNNGKIEKGEYWDNYTQTLGTHTKFNTNKFGVSLNAFYQMGVMADKYSIIKRPRNLNAFLIGLDFSYKPIDKLSLGLGYEYQSGNSQTDTTADYAKVNHAFTPFFGTNHKFNGHMDYFYVGNHIGKVGLHDIYFKTKYKTPKFYVGGDFHAFLAGANVLDTYQQIKDPTTIFDKTKSAMPFLGFEMDLYVGFPLAKGVNFKMGHSTMFGSETLEMLSGGDAKQFNNWAYAQVVFKPTFFNSQKFKKKNK